MTDAEKDEVVALAVEYMRAHKGKDVPKETISRQRVLLFMALEKAGSACEHRRSPEESARAGSSSDGAPSYAHVG